MLFLDSLTWENWKGCPASNTFLHPSSAEEAWSLLDSTYASYDFYGLHIAAMHGEH